MEGTMKALVLVDAGKTEYCDVPIPKAGEDDIVIRVRAAGICGGDMSVYYGIADPGRYPVTMGHEFAGELAHVGKNVEGDWKVGDRVVSDNTYDVCGVCPSCMHGNFVNCAHRVTMGWSANGAFTTYVVVPGHLLKHHPHCILRIPDSLSYEEASVLEPAANGYKATVQEGGIRAGENIVIFGAGPMGLMSLQHATIAGAAKRIIVGLSGDKEVRFDIARKYGATHCLCSDEVDVVEQIKKICGEYGVRLAIDAAGAPITMHQALQVVRNEGTVVRIGKSSKPYNYSLDDLTCRSITLRGHEGYNAESWQRCIDLAASGQLDLHTIISQCMPLDDYAEGFELMRQQKVAKVVLTVD